MARKLGAVDVSNRDPVNGILCLTAGRGVDVANEALGRQETFAAVLLVLRPGETLSSPRVCSTDPMVPLGAFAAGLGDLHRTIGSPSIISRRRAISSF